MPQVVDTCQTCTDLELVATLDSDGTTQDASTCLCDVIELELPHRLVPRQGGDISGTLVELTVQDVALGVPVLCVWRPLDDAWTFAECDRPLVAGDAVHTDSLTLHLDGEPGTARLEVALDVEDAACRPAPTLSDRSLFAGFAPAAVPNVYSPDTSVGTYDTTATVQQLRKQPAFYAAFSAGDTLRWSHDLAVFDVSQQRVATRQATTDSEYSVPALTALVAWDGRDDAGSPLPDGAYTFTLHTQLLSVTVDGQGNEQTRLEDFLDSPAAPVTIDRVAPELAGELWVGVGGTPMTLVDGMNITASQSALFMELVAGDAVGLSHIEVLIDGDSAWRRDVGGTSVVVSPVIVPPGSPTVSIDSIVDVVVTDLAGNTSTRRLKVVRSPVSDQPREFLEALREAFCIQNEACGLGWLPTPASACLADAQRAGLFSVPLPTLQYVALDTAQAETCLAELYALTCDEIGQALRGDVLMSEQCLSALEGRLRERDDCFHPLECDDLSVCEGLGERCPGTCTASEDVCGSTICEFDEFCHPPSLTCRPLGGENAPCVRAGDDHQCQPGLYCVEVADQQFECVSGQPAQAACDAELPCERGLTCAPGDQGGSWCQPPTFGAAVGEPCMPTWVSCTADAYCDRVSSLCRARSRSGEACDDAVQCELGLACVRSDPERREGTCGAPLRTGERCTTSFDCESGRCQDSVCVDAWQRTAGVCVR